MILDKEDAIYAANFFIDYFSNMDRIDEYFRRVKIERMKSFPTALPGMGMRDYFFSDFDIHPSEMKFSIRESDVLYDDLLDLTASHVVERSVPGRTIKLTIYEDNTQSVVGFIRLGSCVINSRPRNEWLGKPLDTSNVPAMQRFNQAAVMGHIIVPAQPFGFNYLGGKLLAGLCTSHEARLLFNKKYDTNICHFETTSLYGSSKTASQYDGMKPFLRFKGLTDSDFAPMISDDYFKTLKAFFKRKNNNVDLIDTPQKSKNMPVVDQNAPPQKGPNTIPTSIKMKTQNMMISITKSSLKEAGQDDILETFNKVILNSKNLNEQKRVFFSNYGFENSREYILGEADELKKAETFDRHYQENIIEWWKKLASKRYEKLKSEDRVRRELELWNENTNIDIIR
jgi:hypothetical protein